MHFWRALASHVAAGAEAFVGLVGDHTRHSPGTRGAKIFVKPDGTQVGTVGGGVMEATLVERARVALSRSDLSTSTQTLHHRADADGERSGLICAGRQSMVYFLAGAHHASPLGQFADAIDADESVELQVDGGTLSVIERAVGLGPPIELRGAVYAEHAVRHLRVAIAGGGHCATALSRVMSPLGYHIEMFETRGDVFTFVEDHSANVKRVVDDFSDAAQLVSRPTLTHFVVMTANMQSDLRALMGAVTQPFPFIGVMGSEAKIRSIRAGLKEWMVAESLPTEVLDSLYAPIGLQMTSNTPEEIAISVAAQILRERETLFPWARPSPVPR